MSVVLLDANVLIALSVAEHEHHDAAAEWFAGGADVATSPVVEGALVRFLVRLGEAPETAQALIRDLHAHPACRRWTDDVSYADIDLSRVRGFRQVTDSYLVGLAAAHGAGVATLDRALADRHPDVVQLISGA